MILRLSSLLAVLCVLTCYALDPFVETYWESYLSFPYNESNCYYANNQPNTVDKTAFGYDLKQIPGMLPGPAPTMLWF